MFKQAYLVLPSKRWPSARPGEVNYHGGHPSDLIMVGENAMQNALDRAREMAREFGEEYAVGKITIMAVVSA